MRNLLFVSLFLCLAVDPSAAQSLLVVTDRAPDEVVALWPDGAPGGRNVDVTEHFEQRAGPADLPMQIVTDVTAPTLSIFRAREPDGSALLIVPGGGYSLIVVDHEGWESARWFSRRGPTVYVMTYRLLY